MPPFAGAKRGARNLLTASTFLIAGRSVSLRETRVPDDDADSLMKRAEWLREIATAVADADAVKVLEDYAAELVAKAAALLQLREPPVS